MPPASCAGGFAVGFAKMVDRLGTDDGLQPRSKGSDFTLRLERVQIVRDRLENFLKDVCCIVLAQACVATPALDQRAVQMHDLVPGFLVLLDRSAKQTHRSGVRIGRHRTASKWLKILEFHRI